MGYNQAIACAGGKILEKTGQLQARGVALEGLCLPKQPPEHLPLVHTLNTLLLFSCSLESTSPGAQEVYPGTGCEQCLSEALAAVA